ncbi:MAG: hypothetical protein WBB19_13090 [Desulforhopalus sp.]
MQRNIVDNPISGAQKMADEIDQRVVDHFVEMEPTMSHLQIA